MKTYSPEDSGVCDTLVEVVEAKVGHGFPSMAHEDVNNGYDRLKGPLLQAHVSRKLEGRHRLIIRFLDNSPPTRMLTFVATLIVEFRETIIDSR